MAVDTSALATAVEGLEPGVDSLVGLINELRNAINADLAGDAAAQAVVNANADKIIAAKQKIADAMANQPTP